MNPAGKVRCNIMAHCGSRALGYCPGCLEASPSSRVCSSLNSKPRRIPGLSLFSGQAGRGAYAIRALLDLCVGIRSGASRVRPLDVSSPQAPARPGLSLSLGASQPSAKRSHGAGRPVFIVGWRLGPARFGSYFGGCFSIYRTSSMPASGVVSCDRQSQITLRVAHCFLDALRAHLFLHNQRSVT